MDYNILLFILLPKVLHLHISENKIAFDILSILPLSCSRRELPAVVAVLVAVLVFPFILAMHYNHLALSPASVIKRSVSFTLTLVQVSSFPPFLGAGGSTFQMFKLTFFLR